LSSSSKAWMVLVGTLGFFAIALLGPALSSAGDSAVRTVLDGEAGMGRVKAEKKMEYASNTAVKTEQACCAQCTLEWDFSLDRCTLVSEVSTRCVSECGANGPAPAPAKPAH
jgi:hypothetical protein